MDTNQMEINSWIPFQEVNFNDKHLIQFHVDTRDFYCRSNNLDLTTLGDKINWSKIGNYPDRFFFSVDEVKSFLERIYTESNGKGEWRHLMLDIPNGMNWNLKYLRIYRITEGVFLICNKDSYALKREILEAKVVDEYLNFIKEPIY